MNDPVEKINLALSKSLYVKSKIYIKADEHTFQTDMVEIINLLSEAINICTDNVVNAPYQRLRPAALLYRDEFIVLKQEHDRLKKIEEEYNKLEGELHHATRKRLENRVIAHDAVKKNIVLRRKNEQFNERVKKLIENKKEQQKDHAAESAPFKLLQSQILELESLFD